MTIPGIDFVNGEIILGKIGDIHRFSEPKKLLAFAGLDPSVHQSGNFQAKRTRISKRGSRVLRYALMNAALHFTGISGRYSVLERPLSEMKRSFIPTVFIQVNGKG